MFLLDCTCFFSFFCTLICDYMMNTLLSECVDPLESLPAYNA